LAGGLYQTLRGSGQQNMIFVLLSPFVLAILLARAGSAGGHLVVGSRFPALSGAPSGENPTRGTESYRWTLKLGRR